MQMILNQNKPIKESTHACRLETSRPNKRSVSFNEVEVREYALELSDNPACSWGPAISIGWSYEPYLKLDIDEYEKNRPTATPREKLRMSKTLRETIMNNSNFTKKEVRQYVKKKAIIAEQRLKTSENLPFEHYEEKLENAKRKLKRIIFFRKKDAELKKLWPAFEEQESLKIKDEDSFSTASLTSDDSEL